MCNYIKDVFNKIKLFFRRHPQNEFPPKLSRWQRIFLFIIKVSIICALLYILGQTCPIIFPISSICGTYFAFGVLLAMFLFDRILRHKILVHEARLEDPSEIHSLFVEAANVELRLTEPEKRPKADDYKIENLKKEVERLKGLGKKGWTEYQVLSLNQMFIEFLKIEELKARAKSTLEDLQEYSDDRYDEQHYKEWKERVVNATKKIEDIDKEAELKKEKPDLLKIDDSAEMLRAELNTLLEHVADYDRYWAEGSAVINNLKIYLVVAVILGIPMSLISLWHPGFSNVTLSIFNWGLLGIVGSIAAVLMSLYKSDYVDVGNTKGRKVLSRSVIGTSLGFLAGIILYSLIAGGILDGLAFPDIPTIKPELKILDIYRSIFWGIASGFCFESIFGYLESKTEKTVSEG